jgi:hypothetical protein
MNRRWKFHVSEEDSFDVAVNMEKKDVTWFTMLQIYLFPAAAIGTKVAISSSVHFLTMPKVFHSVITVIYNVQYLFSTACINIYMYIYIYSHLG